MELYLHFSLTMARSPGFGSMATDFIRAINTRFRFASGTEYLKLASYYNSPDRSTKSTTSHFNVLCVLVNIRFQVLFTPPPRFFSPFLHSTAPLSVTEEYLGLEGGPPDFPPDFSCPVVLWILTARSGFRVRDCYPL